MQCDPFCSHLPGQQSDVEVIAEREPVRRASFLPRLNSIADRTPKAPIDNENPGRLVCFGRVGEYRSRHDFRRASTASHPIVNVGRVQRRPRRSGRSQTFNWDLAQGRCTTLLLKCFIECVADGRSEVCKILVGSRAANFKLPGMRVFMSQNSCEYFIRQAAIQPNGASGGSTESVNALTIEGKRISAANHVFPSANSEFHADDLPGIVFPDVTFPGQTITEQNPNSQGEN